MANLYTWNKLLSDGTTREASGHTVKLGKGKLARHILGIYKYTSRTGGSAYEIDHIPTGLNIISHITYLSTARILAHEISLLIDADSAIFPESKLGKIRMYLKGYEFAETKSAVPFEEYINGPDYEADLLANGTGSDILGGPGAEYARELSARNISIGWVPSAHGNTTAQELRELVSGRYRLR